MNTFIYYLIILFCLQSINVFCDIIPAERRINWAPGIPGGIPLRTTIFTDVKSSPYNAKGDGVTDDTLAIQAALNLCPSNLIVYLPAGIYKISGSLSIPHSGVTLRGSGPGQSIIDAYGTNGAVISFMPVSYIHIGPFINVIGGADKGSSNITLSSTAGISPGKYLCIDQLNDTNFVTQVGYSGTATWVSRDNGNRALGQIVEVLSVIGNTVNVDPPLYLNYSHSLSPQVSVFPAGNKYSGVEDLTVRCNHTGYMQNFRMEGAAYCWLKNVESDYTDGDHVDIYNSYRCEIRECYFHDAFHHTPGGTDACVMLAHKSSACLVENNILWRLHVSIMMNWGAAGNVISYNYCNNNFDEFSTNATMMDLSCHGAHPMFNLWEANYGVRFCPDAIWGSSSHGTAFRNAFSGITWASNPINGRGIVSTNSWWTYQRARSVNLDRTSLYYNILGNILGSAYYTNNNGIYMGIPPTQETYETPYIYLLGYANLGATNIANIGDKNGYSTNTAFTTLIHGNWDWVTQTQQWNAQIIERILPASLYLNEKPIWFESQEWPPFNPNNPYKTSGTNLPAGYRFYLFNSNAFLQPPITKSLSATSGIIVNNGQGTGSTIYGMISSTGSNSFGHYNKAIAQRFIAGDNFTINKVSCRISRTGSPTFNVTCCIYDSDMNSNMPLNKIGTESSAIAANTMSASESDVIFTELSVPVKKGETYWLVLKVSNTSYPYYINWHYRKCDYDPKPTLLNSSDTITWNKTSYSTVTMFTPSGVLRSPSNLKIFE